MGKELAVFQIRNKFLRGATEEDVLHYRYVSNEDEQIWHNVAIAFMKKAKTLLGGKMNFSDFSADFSDFSENFSEDFSEDEKNKIFCSLSIVARQTYEKEVGLPLCSDNWEDWNYDEKRLWTSICACLNSSILLANIENDNAIASTVSTVSDNKGTTTIKEDDPIASYENDEKESFDFEFFSMADRINVATMRNNFLAITKGVDSKETFDDLNLQDKMIWSYVFSNINRELLSSLVNNTDISKASLFVVARQSYQTVMIFRGEKGHIPLCSINWHNWSDDDKNLWSSVLKDTTFNPKNNGQDRNNIVEGLLNNLDHKDISIKEMIIWLNVSTAFMTNSKAVFEDSGYDMSNEDDHMKILGAFSMIARRAYEKEVGMPLCSDDWEDWSNEEKQLWGQIYLSFDSSFAARSSIKNFTKEPVKEKDDNGAAIKTIEDDGMVKGLWNDLLNKVKRKPSPMSTPKTRPPQAKP